MYSIHRIRFFPAHSVYIILLLQMPSTAVAQSRLPVPGHQLDEQALVRLMYEGQNDPDFDGEVRFLRGVPLISRAPNTRPESQYYTSLILSARHMTEGMLYPKIRQLFTEVLLQDEDARKVGRRMRMRAAGRAINLIFGKESGLATFDPEHSPGNAGEDQRSHEHPHEQGTPMRIGFSASRLEVTTGLQVLFKVDAHLRNATDMKESLLGALGTEGIDWRIYNRETVDSEHCKRFISRFVPFVAHRHEGDLLVCGYCTYKGVSYLMGFDIGKIERRVTLGGGGASVTYSQYVKRKDEAQARGDDPVIKLDPLFWDYKSYFSIKNLDCFRITPVRDTEKVTALYPKGFDKEKVVSIIRDELEKAKAEYAKLIAERLEHKRKMLKGQPAPVRKEDGN